MWELTERQNAIQEIIESDPRFSEDAYTFILDTLRDVIENLEEVRHVTGRELSEGCRKRAIEQFGPLARSVLEYWGVRKTADFGEIVYNLIKANQLTKTDEDSKDDFNNVFDFNEAFARPYPWGKVS